MPTIKQNVYQEVLGLDNHQFTGLHGKLSGDSMTMTPSPSPMMTRPTSALDHCHQEIRPGQRPKSTPHYGMKGQANVAKISRPKTAAVILGRTECDRVQQLEHEATRRHNFENHMPLKKSKPPPWQKNLEPPLVPVVTGPGYILSRSKSKYAVTLKEDFFDYTAEDSARKRNYGDPERDGLIAQLQQQISDLTLYLEEERMNHRQTKQKAEEFLKDKVDQLTSQHQDHVRELEMEHKDELHKQKSDMEAEHKEYQMTTEKQISRMAKEIEFLQGAFESYKSTLHTETWDKWKAREEEMNQKHLEEQQQALHDFKMKMIQERNQERSHCKKEHQKAMDALRKENKKEMDGLVRRFANAAADFERLKRATAELEETKTELETITQSYNETCQRLTNTTHQLTDAKVKLMEWEKRFQEKITLVDDKYRGKLQELMSQNTELKLVVAKIVHKMWKLFFAYEDKRRLFVQKCGELFNEKNQSEHQTVERVKTAKETMESIIKLRQRADVSIAAGGPVIHNKSVIKSSRPLSAPGTRQEVETAHESAGEASKEDGSKSTEGFVAPYIYLEPDPNVEEMREELLLSCRDSNGNSLL